MFFKTFVMDTLDCIESRRSIRKFLDMPVEAEKIGKIINAGRLGPSSGNCQDKKFIIVSDEDKKKKIAQACLRQHWIETAPVIIVVCGEVEKTERLYDKRGKELYCNQNSTIAATQMLLAAHDQGLGSCWVGGFVEAQIRKVLNIPENIIPFAVLPIGYADEKPKAHRKLTLENITFFDKWGNRVKDMAAFLGYYSTHVAKMAAKTKTFWQNFVKKLQK